MAKPKIYVTRVMAEQGLALLRDWAEMRVWPEDRPVPREILLQETADCDGLLAMLTDRIDGELLDACPKLRVVSDHAVGYDNIEVAACTERGVLVGNTPGVLTETTADVAFALILGVARRMAEMVDYVKQDKWQTWGPLENLGTDVHHATLGILGMGRIGYEVGKRARGFDMQILYHNRTRNPEAEDKFGAVFVSKEELLRRSDFVSVHVPLTAATRHYIGAAELSLMKPTAFLINTARGPVVNQAALLEALQANKIAGAGLDVTDPEPMRASDPLLALPQVTIVPHIGSATYATRGKMAEIAARNLIAALSDQPMVSCVNPEALKIGRNS
jgi:glyoxylate reductase